MNELKELKRLLDLPEQAVILSIRKHKKKKGGKEYVYLNANYELRGKIRQKYIRKDLESSVERLWRRYKEKKERVKKQVSQVIKSSPPEILKEVMSELLRGEFFNIQDNLKKARELFREFRNELIQLYKEGVFRRLTILQTLYLLANLRELAKGQSNYESFFREGIDTIIKIVRNAGIPEPFERLKQVFFISERRTPYDFLLSNLLQEIIGDIFMELLEKEMEKIETEQKENHHK